MILHRLLYLVGLMVILVGFAAWLGGPDVAVPAVLLAAAAMFLSRRRRRG